MTRFLRVLTGTAVLTAALASLPSPASAESTMCLGLEPNIRGTSGPDVLVGTEGDDVILGLAGADLIRGRGGDDVVCAGGGADVVLGGSGNDRIVGGWGDDELAGNGGDDLLRGGNGDDLLDGGSDHDTIQGDAGADLLIGNGGDDDLDGGDDPDDLQGGPGADLLMGGGGDDELTGGGRADGFDGGPGDDVLWEFRNVDTHLAEGTPEAAGDVFAYSSVEVTPKGGWVRWQPRPGDYDQGHEGILTITNLPDGLLMIERIDPERYLLGLYEMPFSWPEAALQSQAVAARTYLASVLDTPWGPMVEYGFDICDWALCQVYKGSDLGDGLSWEDAVAATEGRVLMYGGSPAGTFYHSTSGETTRSIQDVWTSVSPLPYLQAVPVPEQNSPYTDWWYRLPLEAFLDILAQDGITFDGQVETIRTIVTDHGDGPYRVRIRTTEETREYEITTIQIALNRHALDLYGEHLPPLHHVLGQAALSPTLTVRLRADGDVAVKGQGWGHQIGLSQYGAWAMADLGSTADEILGHFYTGLAPEDDPGLVPDLIDVGLAYDSLTRVIVLRPEAGYILRNAEGIVKIGTGGSITLERYGDGAVAVTIGS